MHTAASLAKLRKADLVEMVLSLQLTAPVGAVGAVQRLAVELGELGPQQAVDVATALSLAQALDDGPELARAGIAKQLLAVTDRLEVDEGEADFVDQLAARRIAGGPDPAEAAG